MHDERSISTSPSAYLPKAYLLPLLLSFSWWAQKNHMIELLEWTVRILLQLEFQLRHVL